MPLIFDHLDSWRTLAGSVHDQDLSELHGLVCGLWAGRPRQTAGQLLVALEPLGQWSWVKGIREALLQDVTAVATALDSEDFSFALLLPDDSQPLDNRTCSLAAWCAGFVAGFGAVYQAPLTVEQQEILTDLEQITRASAAAEGVDGATDEGAEPLESAYSELVEYIRMAAMLMRQSTQNQQQSSDKEAEYVRTDH